jgi:hypothetical protein
VDGDESYPLGAKGFGRAKSNQGVGSTWGGDDANTERRFSFVDAPYEQTVVTAASTHTRHPHVLSVKLPRPVADHIKFQPMTGPPLSAAVAELRVRRPFGGFSFPETSFIFFEEKEKEPIIGDVSGATSSRAPLRKRAPPAPAYSLTCTRDGVRK